MKPLYSKVILDDFASNMNNSPVSFTLEKIQNTNNYNNLQKRMNSGSVQYPIVSVDTRWFEYIKDKVVPGYDLSDSNGQKAFNEFDYINTLPAELYPQITILATNISELASLEEFIMPLYQNGRQLTIEHPNLPDKTLDFEISIRQTHKIKRNQEDIGNDHVYISNIYLISNKCVSFTEKYSAAQLELDSSAKTDIIERIAALEDIKSVIQKQDNISGNDTTDMIDKAWAELDSLVDCVNGLTTYRKLYDTMTNNQCNADEALSIIKKELEKQQKQAEKETARILDIEKRFSKKGDKVLNRFTDAVVEDIKNKLNNDSQPFIYGGTTFMEWYRLDGKKELQYPNILIYTDTNYTFDYKQYTNVNAEGGSVVHEYTQNALPIIYGIRIQIQAKTQDEIEIIDNQIRKLYANEIQVCVPDPVIEGETIPLRLVIDEEKSPRDDFYDDISGGCTRFQTVITFKKFPSVYYPVEYVFTDIKDNQRLQVRLLQQAEFLLLCDSYLRNNAINQLNSDYKNLFCPQTANKSILGLMSNAISTAVTNVVSMALSSEEEYEAYKTLKTCMKNGQPLDRKTFDKAFSKITLVYPNLYNKMAQGWSLEQIRNDLNKYADIFNNRWNSICNTLAVVCPLMFQQLGMSGDKNMPLETIRKGLEFYMNKMVNDPYYTMTDAKNAYDEQLQIEKEEEERREQEAKEAWDSMMEARRERRREGGSSGGFFGNMFSTAGGVAIGNKMSGNSKRKDEKKDFFGSSVCQRCNSKSTSSDRYTCYGCPVYSRCTQQYR